MLRSVKLNANINIPAALTRCHNTVKSIVKMVRAKNFVV